MRRTGGFCQAGCARHGRFAEVPRARLALPLHVTRSINS